LKRLVTAAVKIDNGCVLSGFGRNQTVSGLLQLYTSSQLWECFQVLMTGRALTVVINVTRENQEEEETVKYAAAYM